MPPRMAAICKITIEFNGHHGGWDVTVDGIDHSNTHVQWTDRALFMQRVEEIIKSIRINSSL